MHGGQDNEDSGCERYSENTIHEEATFLIRCRIICAHLGISWCSIFRWLACDSIPELLQGDALQANEKPFVVDDFLS